MYKILKEDQYGKQLPSRRFWFFSADLVGQVLQLRFKNNLMEHLASLEKRDLVSGFAERVLKSKEVKVILVSSDFNQAGCESYTKFFLEKSQHRDMLDIHRLYNITSKLVLGILGIDRIVIHACQNSVISLFLNISLACDYRIAADNTVFCNPYIDLGLIPLGGGPYFLSKMLGTGKAWEILLLQKDIDAQKALDLGLVDKIVDAIDLETTSMDIAQKFAQNHISTVTGLKKLINFSKRDLEQYFELEKQEITKILYSNDFSEKC